MVAMARISHALRVSQLTVSKLGVSGNNPSTLNALWVVRRSQKPWYEAGTHSELPVLMPSLIMTWLGATADVGPLDDPLGIALMTAPFGFP